MKMNVQMIWNGTNHDWFKTDKAHKLDENVYVFNKNNGRKRSFEKKKYIKIQHESFKYQMNVFIYGRTIRYNGFCFYSIHVLKLKCMLKNQRKDTLSLWKRLKLLLVTFMEKSQQQNKQWLTWYLGFTIEIKSRNFFHTIAGKTKSNKLSCRTFYIFLARK